MRLQAELLQRALLAFQVPRTCRSPNGRSTEGSRLLTSSSLLSKLLSHLFNARHLPVPPHMSQGTTPVPKHSRQRGSSATAGSAAVFGPAAVPGSAASAAPLAADESATKPAAPSHRVCRLLATRRHSSSACCAGCDRCAGCWRRCG